MQTSEFQVVGQSKTALFTLKLHRGDGMTLLAMNWKNGKPSNDFVGFAIEYKEPGGDRFFALKNRLSFSSADKKSQDSLSTMLSPIQKFRWVHFPRNANLDGEFKYRVTPVFMNQKDELSYGDAQEVGIVLKRETYPGQLNVAFTRGFVSSQAFVDRYGADAMSKLLPAKADQGLNFKATHPKAIEALSWMGFEAREEILSLLDKAIADKKAEVKVVAYDLNEPEVVSRLELLGNRLQIIIDDEGAHGESTSAETKATQRLSKSAGKNNVKRQHMGQLQHNKTIVVVGPKVQAAVCGSTNFSWRGMYVQSNNAVIVQGKKAIKPFIEAFNNYWNSEPADFGKSNSAVWTPLELTDIDAKVSFSPHSAKNALLDEIAKDMLSTKSNLFFSLAFLYQTKGAIRDAIEKLSQNDNIFMYGISDKKVGGLDLQKPSGNLTTVYSAALAKNIPEPFKTEASGGTGTCMHHKFVVIDFDKPTARVYLGSYNFSATADRKNGENLVLIRDRKVATSYLIEALSIFDHYHFRVAKKEATKNNLPFGLQKPPKTKSEKPWWTEFYTDTRKIKDREMFA